MTYYFSAKLSGASFDDVVARTTEAPQGEGFGIILINEGSPLPEPERPETHLLLPKCLPVFITYLTATVEGEELVRRADPYGWDEQQLAA